MSLRHPSSPPCPFASIPDALEHWALSTPHAPALTQNDEVLTFAQLSERVGAVVHSLNRLGVRPGDRVVVVVVGHNTINWVVAYLAILRIGGIVAPANNRLSAEQFARQVSLLGAIVLTDEAHLPLCDSVRDAAVHTFDDAFVEADELAATPRLPAIEPSKPALISFTSGTTGEPKGAVHTMQSLVRASWAFAEVMATTHRDSTLVMVPLFHNTGFVDQLGHMLLVGGRTDLLGSYRTSDAIAALTSRPTTFLTAVPSIVRLLMIAQGADQAFASVTTLLYGGSPMPTAWSSELLSRWPSMRLFHGYGLTEFGSAVSFLPPEYASTEGESVGFPAPEVQVRIVGDDGLDVTSGETGELWVRGPTVMSGYWAQPQLTTQKIHDGWLRTGDLARWRGSLLYLEGRVDDVINRGGEKVLPAFVESILAEEPAVAQSTVFSVPDPILQSRVWAAIEQRPGTTFDEAAIRSALARQLPDYAVPERIIVLPDLPRTASGKVDRYAVAAQFSGAVSAANATQEEDQK